MDEKYSFALRKLALLGAMDDYIAISSRELGEALEMSQQSASKRILELLDEKYIVRDLGARRQRIKLTQKGIDDLKKEYNEYRRIFELTDHITIHGNVVSGMGEGGYYICQDGYKAQFQSKLGFSPFEGTLNIQVDPEDVGKLDVVRSTAGIMISGFSNDGRSFGDVIAYRLRHRGPGEVPLRGHHRDHLPVPPQEDPEPGGRGPHRREGQYLTLTQSAGSAWMDCNARNAPGTGPGSFHRPSSGNDGNP